MKDKSMRSTRIQKLSRRAILSYGQPISDLMSKALANPSLISLAAGFVDQGSLPCEGTREAMRRLTADESAMQQALQYGTTSGYPPLREVVLDRLKHQDQLSDDPTLNIDRMVMKSASA